MLNRFDYYSISFLKLHLFWSEAFFEAKNMFPLRDVFLPEWSFVLVAQVRLSLDYNSLQTLPGSMKDLRKLEELLVRQCPEFL